MPEHPLAPQNSTTSTACIALYIKQPTCSFKLQHNRPEQTKLLTPPQGEACPTQLCLAGAPCQPMPWHRPSSSRSRPWPFHDECQPGPVDAYSDLQAFHRPRGMGRKQSRACKMCPYQYATLLPRQAKQPALNDALCCSCLLVRVAPANLSYAANTQCIQ